jgi:Flp pilus assembly protein TadD
VNFRVDLALRRLSLCLGLLLAGCAVAPAPPLAPASLWRDDLFAPAAAGFDDIDPFALSEAMQQALRTDVAQRVRERGAQAGLIDALYTHGSLKLEYDSTTTRTAAQAFEARSGNCLSLVLMTAAFAKAMGMPVRYHSAFIDESWSRSGNLLLRNGHINITLGRRLIDRRMYPFDTPLLIDFLPADELQGLRTREIAEPTVLAMFSNNRAVEALAQGRVDEAYAWTRRSIGHDAGLNSAYNTLGVVYTRKGLFDAAEAAFNEALQRDAGNAQALANLAELVARQGRADEAALLRQRLARVEPHPPLHFLRQALAAMQREDYPLAHALLQRELARNDSYHETHFWLGVVSYKLGDSAGAARHLQRARDSSTQRSDQDLYAAKLAWLRSAAPGDALRRQ